MSQKHTNLNPRHVKRKLPPQEVQNVNQNQPTKSAAATQNQRQQRRQRGPRDRTGVHRKSDGV